MISLVCPDCPIGDPYRLAIALPDLTAYAVRHERLRRERIFNSRTKELSGDVESLLSYPIWSRIDHPSPSHGVRSAGLLRSEKMAARVKQF
jgi:hypothetical protein